MTKLSELLLTVAKVDLGSVCYDVENIGSCSFSCEHSILPTWQNLVKIYMEIDSQIEFKVLNKHIILF